MLWFQFLRHLVSWIFLSIWWVGRFHRSPFADILKLFQSILRTLATRKVYKWFTSWTLEVNHTHHGFLLFFSCLPFTQIYIIQSSPDEQRNTEYRSFCFEMYSILFQTKKTVELWRFVTIKACHYGLRHEFFYSWIWGVGNLNPVLWRPDTSQHHKIRLRINPKPYCEVLK